MRRAWRGARSRGAMALGTAYVLVSLGAYVAADRAPGHRVLPYVLVHGALTALMLAAWAWLRRTPRDGDRDMAVAVLVIAGGVARFALTAVAPFTTTDLQRYLWDAAVALQGHDPYVLPPLAPVLAGLRAGFPLPADHLDVATCYPPLALAVFALATVTGPVASVVVWKLLVAGASTATAWVVWHQLKDTPRGPDAVLAALSPILVLEAGVGGHLDAFSALAVAVAVTRAESEHWDAAAVAAGCAGALKLVPGLVAVPLFFRSPRRVRFAVLAALPLGVTMVLARALGMTPPGTLGTVAQNWSFAAPLWTVLYGPWDRYDALIRTALGVAGLVGWALLGLRPGPVARNVRDAYGWGLVVSPVLYPWYGMPLAALSALSPAAWTMAMIHIVPVSYEVIDGFQSVGQWHPRTWPLWVITGVTTVGLALDVALRVRRGRAP